MLIDRLNKKHPLAGKRVQVQLKKPEHDPFNLHGKVMRISDWWHRASGESWQDEADYGLAVCKQYALRRKDQGLGLDDCVIYGYIDRLGYIVHETEISELPD